MTADYDHDSESKGAFHVGEGGSVFYVVDGVRVAEKRGPREKWISLRAGWHLEDRYEDDSDEPWVVVIKYDPDRAAMN
jgi:hypothetical protein